MDFFKKPDRIFHGTDFWMLNDALDEKELLYQLDQMCSQGVYSVVARTYVGLKSDYPGKEFMKKISAVLKRATENGMTVFLQAAYMPEAVVDMPEEFSLDYLCVDTNENFKGDRVISQNGGYTYYAQSSKTALNLFERKSMEFYIKQSYDIWQPFSEYFGNTVLSVWVDEPSYHSTNLPWFEGLEEIFYEKYGYSLKDNVHKLYFDEDDFKKVRYHYWTLLQKLMEENYFAMLKQWCNKNNLLFTGHLMMEDLLFTQIMRGCAMMPYYKYFDIPGIDILTAHMEWADAPLKRDDRSTHNSYMYTTPMQCVSAAHQFGKKHILCEMYGVSGNGMTFRDFAHYFEHFASFGVNHRSVHGIFYSLHGRSKRQYPPHVNYYQPYWEKYHLLTECCARTSAFISQGKPFAKTLVIHPLETAYTYYRGSTDNTTPKPSEEMNVLDGRFNALTRTLLANHISFEFGDINTIASGYAKVENKKFVVGDMEYETVVIPYTDVLSEKTAQLISEFISCGGNVIVTGHFPTSIDGNDCDVKSKYLKGCDFAENIPILTEKLKGLGDYYKILSDRNDASVRVYHTKGDDKYYYMLFNDDCTKSQNVKLTIPGEFCAKLFSSEDGSVSPASFIYQNGETIVSVKICEGGSRLICFEKDCKATPSVRLPKSEYVMSLPNDFDIKRLNDNVLLLEFCSYKTAEDTEFKGPYTVLTVNRLLNTQNYNGSIVQKFCFKSEKEFKNLKLALEDADECQVFFNGKKADMYDGSSYYFAKQFQVISLPDMCQKGENTIEIRRVFTPLSKAKSNITSLFETQRGSELESIYLLGDFGVYSTKFNELNGDIQFSNELRICDECHKADSELLDKGLVFYTGKIQLSKEFDYDLSPDDFNEISIYTHRFSGCVAEIFLNGTSLGNVFRAPYSVNAKGVLKKGKNQMTIVLYNTLRPLLGPYHNPKGEIGACWGGYGDPDSSWTGAKALGADWYLHTEVDNHAWTNNYNQVPFGVSDIKIVCK